MITVSVSGLMQLSEAVKGIEKDLKRNLSVAINATLGKGKSSIAKEIATELAASQKVIKQQIVSSKATTTDLQGRLVLKKSFRPPLRDFGAKQNKSGVSYRISKTSGRKTIKSAFQVQKWGGRVFIREGKERLPIRQLYGPSPWGVFVNPRRNLTETQKKLLEAELGKQIDRRIRFLLLKAQGKI